jgi:putative arabinosyltransferase
MMAPDAANATPSALPAWPPSSGGVKRQHSVEYWLMASLQDGAGAESAPGREAVRVRDPDAADAFFVPFFSSLSFNVHGRNMTDPDTEADRLLQVRGISLFLFSLLLSIIRACPKLCLIRI